MNFIGYKEEVTFSSDLMSEMEEYADKKRADNWNVDVTNCQYGYLVTSTFGVSFEKKGKEEDK